MSILRSAPTDRQINGGLLVLRLVLGFAFVMHGTQKLFTYGIGGVGEGFAQSGIPLPGVMAALVSFIELFGGIAILLGLLTRVATLGIAATMVGAIMFVHAPAGFFLPNGYEFALSLLAIAATLAITGAGSYSVDAVLERRRGSAAAEAAPGGSSAARRAA